MTALTCQALVLFSLTLVACGTDPDPAGPSTVFLTGQLREASGAPIPRVGVLVNAWPAADTAAPLFQGSVVSDSLGDFTLLLGRYSQAQLDSVQVTLPDAMCSPYGFTTTMLRRVPLGRAPVDTIPNVALVTQRLRPRARLAIGESCGDGTHQYTEGDSVREWLVLWIDDMSDSVRGRWRLIFEETRLDDYGHFSGTRTGDSLLLNLRNEAPWVFCESYDVAFGIEAGDTLSTGRFSSISCPDNQAKFDMSSENDLEWIGP